MHMQNPTYGTCISKQAFHEMHNHAIIYKNVLNKTKMIAYELM